MPFARARMVFVLTALVTATSAAGGDHASTARRSAARAAVTSVLEPRGSVARTVPAGATVSVDDGDPMTIRLFGVHVAEAVPLYVVPAAHSFVLTGIDGSYACQCQVCRLYDSSDLRLAWRTDDGHARSYVTGVRFAAGTTITFDPPHSTLAGCSGGGGYGFETFNGAMAVMGRLVPD